MARHVADESSKLRARARLSLRAERALGLTAIPYKLVPVASRRPDGPLPPPVGAPATPATRPLPAIAPSPTIQATAPSSLQVLTPSREPFDSPVLSTSEKIARLIALD